MHFAAQLLLLLRYAIKGEFIHCYTGGSGGIDEMASREILEDVIERLTMRLKLTKATLKSTSEEFRQAQENLETLEKEHIRVVRQIGELKKRESELISERDEARE